MGGRAARKDGQVREPAQRPNDTSGLDDHVSSPSNLVLGDVSHQGVLVATAPVEQPE